MYPSPDDCDQPLPPPHSARARARDRGLRRSRRLTRWITVAAVTGAAALGSLYTHLLPGSSASPVPSRPPLQNPAASSAVAPKAGDDEAHGNSARHGNDDSDDEDDDAGAARASQPAPQPPAQPPAPTQQPPHTTTGAS